MKKGQKVLLAALLAVTLLFVFLADHGGKESIVICASSEQYRNDTIQQMLTERFPEYNIVVMYMSTGKAAAKVYAEGSGTEVDILLGLETGYLNRIRGELADISGLSTIPYLEGMTPEDNGNLWVTWEKQAGAIVVNTRILEKHGLPAPKTYEDLLDPKYKGLIAMPDPKSSGTGYFFYKNWVNLWGEEGALAYVDALYGNLKQFTESGSGPIKLLKQGEAAIGMALTFQAVTEIGEGQPFEILFPPEGSPYNLTGTAIVSGHREKTGVEDVYRYLIHDCLVYDKTHYSPETVYDGQINNLQHYPANIVYADMTGIQDAAEKERLLSLWKY